jgi:hypothetical protein
MLQQVEEKRAALGEKTSVVMQYRVNGKAPQTWHWPPSSSKGETD